MKSALKRLENPGIRDTLTELESLLKAAADLGGLLLLLVRPDSAVLLRCVVSSPKARRKLSRAML